MNKTILFLIVFLFSFIKVNESYANIPFSNFPIEKFESGEIPHAVVYNHALHATYILTQKSIYLFSNKKLIKYYTSAEEIFCGFANDSSLWIGTNNGIEIIQNKNKTVEKINIEPNVKSYKVISIFKKNGDSLFLATDAYGLYKWYSAQAIQKINTLFPINKGLSTADTSIWIGTDAGLFRNKKGEWTRYNEEGVANFEIPDNIVQNLIVDDFGFLWVLMRNGVAVIDVKNHAQEAHTHPDDMHAHLPSVEFVGDHENTIYDISYFKKKGYVFATELGLLWMPVKTDEELLENFHHGHGEKIENKELLIKLNSFAINQEIGKILFIVKDKTTTSFIGERGTYRLSAKALNALMTQK